MQTDNTPVIFALGETKILCKRPYLDALRDYVDSLPRKPMHSKRQIQPETRPGASPALQPANTL